MDSDLVRVSCTVDQTAPSFHYLINEGMLKYMFIFLIV